jgi:hypothetical protein
VSDPAVAWVEAHLPAAPVQLLDAMKAALVGTDADAPVPDRMAEAALALYAEAARGSGMRDEALGLLAADALLTHAFEAQTGEDPEALVRFARRWGGEGRLAALADEARR